MKETLVIIFVTIIFAVIVFFVSWDTSNKTYPTRVANDIYSDFMESGDVTSNEKQKLVNCLNPYDETFNTKFCIDLLERAKKSIEEEVLITVDDFIKNKYSEKDIRDFIKDNPEELDYWFWANISINQNLSESFIREFQDQVHWSFISCSQDLSEDFLMEFIEKVDIKHLEFNKNIPEDVKERIRNLKKERKEND